jgi:nucleotide-binding universal stress UspA family protein
MDYRSIMVCLDGSADSAALLAQALGLARRHHATLVAVHAVNMPVSPWVAGAEVLVSQVTALVRAEQEEVRRRFQTVLAEAEVNGEFIALADGNVAAALRVARTVDLVVAGHDPSWLAAPVGTSLAIPLLLGAGRPVLFLPEGSAQAPFRSILVAWNDSREAARAVSDALPLLKAADHVSVVSVQRLDGSAPDFRDSGRRLVSGLGRHGVQAVFTAIDTEGMGLAPDEWLSQQTRDDAIDLVVAGGYGHGRMTEMVLGGATRTLLHRTEGPLLMSH